MLTPIRSLIVALAAATILYTGAVTPTPASAFPLAPLAASHNPAVILASASDDAPDADDPVSDDERAYGPYGKLVGLPAVILMWWMRRQFMRGVRRLIGHGLARAFGDVTLASATRAAKPSGGGLFGKSMPSALEERIQRLKPEPSAYDPPPPPAPVPAPAYAAERSFGRRGVR